ncbi:Phosphoserine aminotransferase [Austwickia sp. TVS 96-490-7B]|uniref:phosphoserine transaminase n=1 Tax=Austwickia sp. TVS 96-490-7B TaxID=2830843 RepID=UPI001C566E31|nr:phosphoserine transaminase [Austwickia sp. TVS 96-490-7B]MBW3085541.1 Phosphoserine aminotransferase [Austwickia sp. TVS 96-490-7B]
MTAVSLPTIPAPLLPRDGRFGCGPSLIRPAQLTDLMASQVLGTSHRQPPVTELVGGLRADLATLFELPEDYLVVLGNGGTTSFWDMAAFSLIRRRAQHCVFGEFSAKFAEVTEQAPFLETPQIRRAPAGSVSLPEADPDVDVLAWPHNETSTGAMAPVLRPPGTSEDTLTLVDATSAAAGLPVDVSQTDVYYFAPQKCLGSDGGLWWAFLSPRAIKRVDHIEATGRWIPATLRLSTAIASSRRNQTLNTPALTTLVLMQSQVRWLLHHGGMDWATRRTTESATRLYDWVAATPYAQCFVAEPAWRSHVVATIDLDEAVDAPWVAAALRANGVVDVEPYRKLGRNQLRVALFPSIEPDDVSALTRCIDHVVSASHTASSRRR